MERNITILLNYASALLFGSTIADALRTFARPLWTASSGHPPTTVDEPFPWEIVGRAPHSGIRSPDPSRRLSGPDEDTAGPRSQARRIEQPQHQFNRGPVDILQRRGEESGGGRHPGGGGEPAQILQQRSRSSSPW